MADRICLDLETGKVKMNKILKYAVVGMAVVMLAGCGKTEEAPKEEQKQQEEVKEEAEVTKEPTAEPTVEPTEEPEAEVTPEAEENNTDRLIQLPENPESVADYTTVEGIALEPGSRIAFVVKNTETGYWQAVKKGIEQAVNELNTSLGYEGDDEIKFTFEGPKSETDVNDQVNILDAIISENPTVICLAAVDMDSCLAQLEAAQENGIPVIVLDSGVNNMELVQSSCATNNEEAGREAARQLCAAIGDEGEVAVLSHGQHGESSKERVNGFQNEIAENHPQVSVVQVLYEPQTEKESPIDVQAEAVLALYPDLKGFFSTNEVMGGIVLSVMEQHKDKNIAIVSFDLGQVQEQAVRDGRITGVISQNPYSMGYATVVAGARAALGMENDGYIDAGYQWLDQSNIDLEENKKYIY